MEPSAAQLRTTVIFKTDLRDSTPIFRASSQQQLSDLLAEQKRLVAGLVQANQGHLIKGEGDAFWVTFPSVTAAALTGMEILRQLRQRQAGQLDEKRLVLRIVIAMGDVLHQAGDIFGYPVNLAARIEKITPPDEIYLSQAAWLSLNPAEVQTELVGAFEFKGVAAPEQVYRVVQMPQAAVLPGLQIAVIDLGGFTGLMRHNLLAEAGMVLHQFEQEVRRVCRLYGGVLRMATGDTDVLSFEEPASGMQAMQDLCRAWDGFAQQIGSSVHLKVALDYGELWGFRQFLFGQPIQRAMHLESLKKTLLPEAAGSVILTTDALRQRLADTPWFAALQPVAAVPQALVEQEQGWAGGTIYVLRLNAES